MKIVKGADEIQFTYDGFGRRVKIVEKESSVTVSDKEFIWNGTSLASSREYINAGDGLHTKYYYSYGHLDIYHEDPLDPYGADVTLYQYTRDHLGSICEMCNNANVVACYTYDPYGRRTRVSGSEDADFGFTGHYYHEPSGLHLTLFRAYDANIGRWLSRDPIGEAGGMNLYRYVHNSPINRRDALGLRDVVMITDYSATGDLFMWGLLAPGATIFADVSSVDDMMSRLDGFAPGSLDTLYLSGHGIPGGAGTSAAEKSLQIENFSKQQSERMRDLFSPNGAVVGMSCQSAVNERAARRMEDMATKWNVPVSMALDDTQAGPDGFFGFKLWSDDAHFYLLPGPAGVPYRL